MVAITKLLCLATAASALVLPRDATKIKSDLKTLNADYIALRKADKAFGSGGSVMAVQNDEDKVSNDTMLTTSDAEASNTLSPSHSQTINHFIDATLEPHIKAAVEATIANKAEVAKAGKTALVKKEMKQLKAKTDAMGNALVAITPTKREVSALKAAFAKIDKDFDKGIAAYSS